MYTRISLSLLFCVAGCSSALDFGSDVERTNLTYAEYAREMGTHYVDPVGGSDVDVRLFCTRDTSDFWLRVSMSPSSFDALVQSHPWHNRLPQTQRIGIPEDWPTAFASTPDWWQLPPQTATTEIIVCESRDKVKPSGAYWQYDEPSQTLWVFDWYHQWGQFGEESQKQR